MLTNHHGHSLICETWEYTTLHGKWYAHLIKIRGLEMGRLAWIIQVVQIQSRGVLKAENLS